MKAKNIITKCCIIRNQTVSINNLVEFRMEGNPGFPDFIKSVYNKYLLDYPKFFKMDNLSKLGFITGELLLKGKDLSHYTNEDIGVVMANSSSSLDTDERYYATIKNSSDYFPSPSLFVYTLPNIMIGELSIKYKLQGENAFFVFDDLDMDFICNYVNNLMDTNKIQSCVAGWVDLYNDKYEAILCLIEKECSKERSGLDMKYTIENIKMLYSNKI
jgi:hypothetical protein